MTDPQRYSPRRTLSSDAESSRPLWQYYVGITALLLVMVVALAGGIIWYNSKKANQLAIAATERMMFQAGENVSNRIKLLYDTMYAIVGIASLVPELISPAIKEDPRARSLLMRVLRIYPQILSLYVGFDSGDFFMVTHVAGENSKELRAALKAPQDTAFASEIIAADAGGERKVRWVFLMEDGSVIGSRDPVPAEFDPRQRPWYDAAKRSEVVEQSELYVFEREGKKLTRMKPKWKDETIARAAWGKTSPGELWFLREDRLLRHVELCCYSLATGECKCLLTDGFDNAPIFTQPIHYIEESNEMLWWSERDGWAHYYLYGADGTLKNQIDKGEFVAEDISYVDEKGRALYLTASGHEDGENPYYQHFYRANLDGSAVSQEFITGASSPIGVAVDALAFPPSAGPPPVGTAQTPSAPTGLPQQPW